MPRHISYNQFIELCRQSDIPRSGQTDQAFAIAELIDVACGAEIYISNILNNEPTLVIGMLAPLAGMLTDCGEPHETRIFVPLV